MVYIFFFFNLAGFTVTKQISLVGSSKVEGTNLDNT